MSLARGWNRQADVQRNPLFYDGTLTEASYRTWLRDWSVRYVVLPAEEPDSSGQAALTVTMPRAGSVLLRVAWSPWLSIAGVHDDQVPRACLAQNGNWTELTTPGPGTFTVAARYALDRGTPCPTAAPG